MDEGRRSTRFSVFNKRPTPLDYQPIKKERKVALPDGFPEKVLEIESWIDKGEFTSEDLSELMLIYSQVVEYYNSINDPKANYYADRIQSTLMKPHVLERMTLTGTDPTKIAEKDQEIVQKRKEESSMNKEQKSQKKAQEYTRKQKERTMKMNVHMENQKKEKKQTLEKIIEEVHQAEDTNVDFVANDMIKQSSELQKRLAERRRKQRAINSCKNANSKSFFKFESMALGQKADMIGNTGNNMNNMSIIKQDSSFMDGNDESFSLGFINGLPDTDTSTLNMTSKIITAPMPRKNLQIETTFSNEEEEEESEDEKLEENLMEIWKEWEKVFETLQSEKEEATNKFIEEFTTNKVERIAELKAELKIKQANAESEEEKQKLEKQFKFDLMELENKIKNEKEEGLSEIKSRFYKRKQSIVSKLDMESAKSKLKASLCYGRDLSFLSTPSSQSFYLSPNEISPKKAQPVSGNPMAKEQLLKPVEKLVTPTGAMLKMPKTPNRMTKIDFNFTSSQSANK